MKGLIMSDSASPFALSARIRQHLPKRNTLLAFLGGIALTVGVAANAGDTNLISGMHDSMMGMHHGHGDMGKHVDAMLAHLYKAVDATDAQKNQLAPIVHQAATELMPLHEQLYASHKQLLNMLSQDTIDRAALETFRVTQLQTVDKISKRLFQMTEDMGDVLTPVQRKQLAEHISRMHAEHHG
jgi:protein CpxP